jgi:vacuolar iron transporter family protein
MRRHLLLLGFANLVADGFAMAAGNYLGTRAEYDDYLLPSGLAASLLPARPSSRSGQSKASGRLRIGSDPAPKSCSSA